MTLTAIRANPYVGRGVPNYINHVYFYSIDCKQDEAGELRLTSQFGLPYKTSTVVGEWVSMPIIGKKLSAASTQNMVLFDPHAKAEGDTLYIKNFICFDLTKMFGSTIADYILSLETASAGAGVAFFRKLFPNPYYAYNTGELMSVQAASHDMVGFNLWDEECQIGSFDPSTLDFGTTGSNFLIGKNKCPIIGGATYYVKTPYPINSYGLHVVFYDGNDTAISKSSYVNPFTAPQNAVSFRVAIPAATYGTTYNHDICISISSDRNGEYEPYEKHTYPLDDSLTLRGIPKLGSNNKLYYNGDTYESDGTVTRKYGIVDLGMLTWTHRSEIVSGIFASSVQNGKSGGTILAICSKYEYAGVVGGIVEAHETDKTFSLYGGGNIIYVYDTAYADAASFKAAMSGVYLVYELATPTTETAELYHNPQIVSEYGTEEYVDAAVEAGTRDVFVPVGHVTKYPTNQVKKLDNLPSNFSTLIAPTEKTTTASQNYAVGSFLIYKNQLYKVTAAIASGATITPGTNVTATTIIEQLMTLL